MHLKQIDIFALFWPSSHSHLDSMKAGADLQCNRLTDSRACLGRNACLPLIIMMFISAHSPCNI